MIIVRIFSFLYHLALGLVLFLLGLIPMVAGGDLKLGMIPWVGSSPGGLMMAGFLAMLSVVLAISGRLKFLLLLWSLVAVVGIFRGYFWSTYQFSGGDEFTMAVWIFVGALIALIGAFSVTFHRKSGPKRR